MSQNCLQRLGVEKEYSMNNKIGRMFCKYVKYDGILLGVLICIPLFCFGIVFISYQIEGWKTEHMIVNEYEEKRIILTVTRFFALLISISYLCIKCKD